MPSRRKGAKKKEVGPRGDNGFQAEQNGSLEPNSSTEAKKPTSHRRQKKQLAAQQKARDREAEQIGAQLMQQMNDDLTSVKEEVTPVPKPPKVDFSRIPKEIIVKKGEKIEIDVPFVGTPRPEAQWARDGKPLSDRDTDIETKDKNSKLCIPHSERSDAGLYELTLTNEVGTEKVPVNVNVNVKESTEDSELANRLNKLAYKNWLKAGLCLKSVKNGIETFAEERSKRCHDHVKDQLASAANPSLDAICGDAKISYCKPNWKMSCSCNRCQQYVDEIIKMRHRTFKFSNSNWRNSDIQLWPSHPWEMMKVFMNAGQDLTQKSPKDTDLSGILNFIDHCVVARNDISHPFNISKVRDARNAVMHSAEFELSDDEFRKHTTAMIDLLQDPLFLCKMPDAKDNIHKIQELQTLDFCITADAELKVMDDITTYLLKQNESQLRILKAEWKDLEKKTAKDKDNVLFMLSEAKKEAESLRRSFSTLRKLVDSDGCLRQEMGHKLSRVEQSFSETREEFGNLKDDVESIKGELTTLKKDFEQLKDGQHVSSSIQQNIQASNVMIVDKNVLFDIHDSSPDGDSTASSDADIKNQAFPALSSREMQSEMAGLTVAGQSALEEGPKDDGEIHKLTYAQAIQNITAKKATVINHFNLSAAQTREHSAPTLTRQESKMNDFLNAVKGFKRGHHILVTGGIKQEKAIQSFGLVPWSVVFDFDPKSRSDGLLSQAEIPITRNRALHITTLEEKCVITEQGTDWIFLKGLSDQPDTMTDDKFHKWKKQTQSWISQIVEELKRFGSSYTDYYVVVMWPSDEKLYPNLRHLLDELEGIELCEFIIIAEKTDGCSEGIFKRMQDEYEKKPTVIHLSVKDVCIAINRVFRHSHAHESTKYDLPTVDSSPVSINDREAQWLKEDLEVLYKQSPYKFEMTLEALKEESENFFRGGNYPWHMWYATGAGQVDAERIIMKDIIRSLRKHIEDFKSEKVTLFHAPGSGGTTLAQRILWELHHETPCVQVKLSTGSSNISNRIQFLYDKTRLPILILVDGEDEQRVELLIQDLQKISFVVLYVKRYLNPMEDNRNSTKSFWLKRFVSKHEATTIAYKFLQQCDSQSKKTMVEKLQREVEKGTANHEIFEFGLATYKHHYKGIESYVNGFMQLDNSRNTELLPWQHALGILSLVYFYGQMAMPCKFFSRLLGDYPYDPLLSIDDFPVMMKALVTKDLGGGRLNVVRISHNMVAKEILEQILSRPYPRGDRVEQLCATAKQKLEPFAVEFIKYAANSTIKSTGMIEKIMTRTFISRDNKAVGETDLVDKTRKPKFAQILHDVSSMPPYSERFHILQELVKSFPHEPQFQAHLGRLYSICKPEEEESAELCFKRALEICRKIVGDFNVDDIPHSMRLTLMHIYHMYGNMFLVKVSKYSGKTFGDQPQRRISDENSDKVLADLFPMVKNACSYFAKCRDVTPQGQEESHGFLGEIKIRLMLCDFILKHIAKPDIYTFIIEYDKAEIADFVEDSIAVIDELFLECLSVVDPEKIEDQLQIYQEWFKSLFEICNVSKVVFRTQDTVKSRRLQITARKLRYQKKKEEVTNRTDIGFIVKNYEANFKDIHESGIECPWKAIDLDYREWLFAIRHNLLRMTYTLEDVLKQVRLWHEKVKTPYSRFYLFILCSLLGFRGNIELLIEAKKIKEDLLKQAKYVTKPRYPREWLGEGQEIRCLIPEFRLFGLIEGREIKDTLNRDCLKRKFGTVCRPNDKPAQGYIRLDLDEGNPVGISVFYVPVKSDMKGPAYADMRVKFYIGFSMAHGYEAYNVRPLKRVKCRKCGRYLEIRSNLHTKCKCGEVFKQDLQDK